MTISESRKTNSERENRLKKFSAVLDPRMVFTGVVVVSFLLWLAWHPEPTEAAKYVSIHALLIAMCISLSFVAGVGAVRHLKRRRLIINYSGVRFTFNVCAILSLMSTWYFILRPVWTYGPIEFIDKTIALFKAHNISVIQQYYLTPGLGLGFITLRWLLAPTFALLQELRMAKKIARNRYRALSVMFLITALIYSIAISSIVRFAEILLVLLVIRFWRAHLKWSYVLLFVGLLYLTVSLGGFFKFAGVYGYQKITPYAVLALGMDHLTRYYGTSLNYGFYLIDKYAHHLTFPKTTFSFIVSALNIGSGRDLYYSLSSTPVFAPGYTTVSGFGQLAAEYGEAAIAIIFLVGMMIGYVYFNADYNLICKLLYPFILVGLLEFPRYFYFFTSPLIAALSVFSVTAILSSPNWCRRMAR